MTYVVSFVDETPTLIGIYSAGLPYSPEVDTDETAYESTRYSPLDQTGHNNTTHDGVAISSNSSTLRSLFGSYQMRPDLCGISEGSASVPNSLSPPQIREQTRGSVDLDNIVHHTHIRSHVHAPTDVKVRLLLEKQPRHFLPSLTYPLLHIHFSFR